VVPDDRAGCVAADVDLMSTYVGGNEACVTAVLEESGVVVWRVTGGIAAAPYGRRRLVTMTAVGVDRGAVSGRNTST
jgi:hypothetical protein